MFSDPATLEKSAPRKLSPNDIRSTVNRNFLGNPPTCVKLRIAMRLSPSKPPPKKVPLSCPFLKVPQSRFLLPFWAEPNQLLIGNCSLPILCRRISFLLRRNWPASFSGRPFAAQLAHQVERAGDEDNVFGRGEFEGARQGLRGVGHDFRDSRMMGRHFREQRGGDGARLRGRRENYEGSAGEEKAGNFVDGFVAHGSVDQENIPPGKELLPEDDDFAGARGVVRAVDINFRAFTDFFEAAGPCGRGEAVRDGFVVDGRASFGQHARGGQSRERVADLKPSGKSQRDGAAHAGAVGNRGERKAAVLGGNVFEVKSVFNFHEKSGLFRTAAANHHTGDVVLGGADHAGAGLDDPRLFRRDFLDRVAEIIFVVEIDLGDHGDFGQKNIRRVQAPAHAGLTDGELRARAGEIHECDRGDALEKSGMRGKATGGEQFLDGRADPRECGGKFLVGNFPAVQANAFVDALKVRRSVQARSQARRAQNRIEHRGGGALSICAGDMHGLKLALRLPKVVAENGYVFQIEFRGARLSRRGEFAPQAVEVLDRFFVGHVVYSAISRQFEGVW